MLLKCRIYYFNQKYNEAAELIAKIEKESSFKSEDNIRNYVELKYLLLLTLSNTENLIGYLKEQLVKEKNNKDNIYFISYFLGKAYFWEGDYLKANHLLQRCHSYYLEKQDYNMLGQIDHMRGYIAYQRRFYDVAETYFNKALESFKKIEKKYQVAATNMMLGILNLYSDGIHLTPASI